MLARLISRCSRLATDSPGGVPTTCTALESHRSGSREERLHGYRVQELETCLQAYLERLEVSTVGVQGNPALRRVQSGRIWDVNDVNPAYTSRRCSYGECGFTHEETRDDDEFECLNCGKQLHGDYNAARNIGWRLIQHWLNSGAGRVTSQLALKSGTVNANGRFRPTE